MTSIVKTAIPPPARPAAKALWWRALRLAAPRRVLGASIHGQALACARNGSPLYARLLEQVAGDVVRGGPCWDVVASAGVPQGCADDALALRFMAGVHRLVLAGRAPALAAHYPSAGGDVGGDPWPAFVALVAAERGALRDALQRPVQTNEVNRLAALIGGFLLAGRLAGGRLRVLELGASAGVNLHWDRYYYEAAGASWGDPRSPVRLRDVFTAGHPPFDLAAEVVDRAGCDTAPLDPGAAEDRVTLASFVWADQVDRLELLDAALGVASAAPVRVERGDAPVWLAQQLCTTTRGVVTVVFDSFVEQYLTAAKRAHLRTVLAEAGARATAESPLAHLRMGWVADTARVDLTTWPGAHRAVLAASDVQGRAVNWIGD